MEKVSTRFMQANKDNDSVVFDILVEEYGMSKVCNHKFDYCEALFSDGFVNAIKNGLIPVLGSEAESFLPKKDEEYHHFIVNDTCYVVYFK